MKPKLIAILTDFGTTDPFVGIMKAVIAEVSAQARWIDISHQVPPGDIQRGAFVLWQSAKDFPAETVFLSVVDPGVGTSRKAIILEVGNQIFIGPDNGLFSYLVCQGGFRAWELSNQRFQRQGVSTTFHGRDIFAPAAAHAVEGTRGAEFGAEVKELVTLDLPILTLEENSLKGEIIAVDHFGNLVTSIGQIRKDGNSYQYNSWLAKENSLLTAKNRFRIKAKDRTFPLAQTFGSIPPGELAGVIGSTGLLEISSDQDSAKKILGMEIGDQVILSWD